MPKAQWNLISQTRPMSRTCPICGGDRYADQSALRMLCMQAEITSQLVDPGGLALKFRLTGHKVLRLVGECNLCDIKAIREFIEKERIQNV